MSTLSSINRVTGLATGLDTESMVKQLMQAEKLPLNKLSQQRQLLEWKRDNYRDMTNVIRGFRDDFFSVLKPNSNMISASPYSKFTTTSTDPLNVTVAANSDARPGEHTIKVTQLATVASVSSSSTTAPVTGNGATDVDFTDGNNKFKITLDGVTKTINLRTDLAYADYDELVSDGTYGLQKLVDSAFGVNKIDVSVDGSGNLSFASQAGTAGRVTLTGTMADNALDKLNFTNGATNTAGVTAPLLGTGGAAVDFTDGNNQFNITLDGVTKTISLRKDVAYADAAELVNDGSYGLQKLVNDAFGSDKIAVSADSGTGQIKFSSVTGASKITLTSGASIDALAKLSFTSGDSNRINASTNLGDLATKFNENLAFDASDELKFSINNIDFVLKKSDTLKDLLSKVNNSAAGVELRYSELNDSFSIKARQTGAGNSITITNTGGNFFDVSADTSASGIAFGSTDNGLDAVFDLDGMSNITRSDNSFNIDGVTYNLNKADSSKEIKVTVNNDVEGVFNSVKAFIDKYNEMIGKINAELGEPKYRDYLPLTDTQKAELTEDEITKWEDKAKSGLLKADPLLQKMVTDMRRALYDAISGISGNLNDIGISTGGYQEKGQLIIDELKLKAAIRVEPDKVKDIFARTSSIAYSTNLTSAERTQRYNEEGIAQRLYDVITDNIRVSRNSSGKKGILIEKAGVIGDVSEYVNTIDNEIKKTNTRITDMNTKLSTREENYYKKFAALEKAISKMNNQSAWLNQQFGSKA